MCESVCLVAELAVDWVVEVADFLGEEVLELDSIWLAEALRFEVPERTLCLDPSFIIFPLDLFCMSGVVALDVDKSDLLSNPDACEILFCDVPPCKRFFGF